VLPPYLRVNFSKVEKAVITFIRDSINSSQSSGVVIGLSGGSDSSVTAALAVRALGVEKVKVIHLPEKESDPYSTLLATKVADSLGLKLKIIDITTAVSTLLRLIGLDYGKADKVVKGNIKVRTRMTILYAIANLEKRLVLGTGDRSEWLIGYFTKWGDSAADIYPIIGLYKTQVVEFGKYLNLPSDVISRPPTPDLWPGHTAESELGLTYEVIDKVLYWIFDRGMKPDEVSKAAGVPKEIVERIMDLHKRSEHKREPLKAPFRSFTEIK